MTESKVSPTELSDRVGVSMTNLSLLKNERVKAILNEFDGVAYLRMLS